MRRDNNDRWYLNRSVDLLKEVYMSHHDPNSPEYNSCDNGEDCQWCVWANEIIDYYEKTKKDKRN